MPLHDLAAAGDRLDTLRGLRDRLATDIDLCESGRDVAALSLRLMDVLEQIAAIEAKAPDVKGTALDELAKRRSDPNAAPRARRAARSN